jgi:hypothetical protein
MTRLEGEQWVRSRHARPRYDAAVRIRFALLFTVVALLYVGPGLLPGRVLLPVDLPRDFLAWKRDPTIRVRVSNSLLSDPVVQFAVWDAEVRRMIGNGEMPWVNRFAGDGGALFANPQTALLSPFTWPRLVFGLHGWVLTALLKLLTAAALAYWLARELEVPREQAVVSALVYACSGAMIVWLLFPITNVLAVLPGLLAASLRLIRQPREKHALLVIAFAALATAGGHPEALMVGVLGAFAFLIWNAERTHRWGALGAMPPLVGAFFGFAILGVILVPFAMIARDSWAASVRPDAVEPFRIWSVISQLLPGILGSPLRGELDLSALPRAESFAIRASGYVGALVLLAILVSWRALSPIIRRGLKIGFVALAFSWATPGLDHLLRVTPVVRLLAVEYCAFVFVLFAAMAAGPALFALASRRRIGVLFAIAGAVMLVSGIAPILPLARPLLSSIAHEGIAQLQTRGHLHQPAAVYEQRFAGYLAAAAATALRRIALPGLMWLIAGIALLCRTGNRACPPGTDRRDRLSYIIVSAAAVGELVAFGLGFNPAVSMREAAPMPEAIATIGSQSLIAANFEVFPANLGTVYGVRDVISYDVLTSRSRVEELIDAGYDPRLHSIHPQLSPANVAGLARLGVRYVVSRDPVPNAKPVADMLWEIPHPIPHRLPANTSPDGLLLGAVISLVALILAAGWLRLFR